MTGGDTAVILHVLESYGAGSARAAEAYAAATPQFRHVVLRRRRAGEYTEGQDRRAFDAVHDLPRAPLAAMAAIRRVIREVQPWRVHAHSSFAGAFVRLAVPARQARARVVYTPHCFAFERRDLPLPARALFHLAEWVLSSRTNVIAACSLREQQLAARMLAARPPVYVPNVSSLPARAESHRRSDVVVSIGRLGAQKDPELFAAIAAAARSASVPVTPRWLGGGDDPAAVDRLVAQGVAVSGWLDPDQLADECAAASTYLHTARWEGFPLAVLEAVTAGLPVVARRIPAMLGAPEPWLFDTVSEAVGLLHDLQDGATRGENLAAWRTMLASNSPAEQRARLAQVYEAPAA